MLVYPVLGELGSDDSQVYWLLLLMILHVSLTIWFLLAGLADSLCSLWVAADLLGDLWP